MAGLVKSVFHPTDFSAADERAFAHALAIALLRRAQLTILHAGREQLPEDQWRRFPHVRRTLEQWGLLAPNSPRSAVFEELGVQVTKIDTRGMTVLRAISRFLVEQPHDLVVLATEGREGLPRWLRPSVAEPAARRSKAATLFVPQHGWGFVQPGDGRISLRRIVLPVDPKTSPDEALARAAEGSRKLLEGSADLTLLHVGAERDVPDVMMPSDVDWTWSRAVRSGDPAHEIAAEAGERQADLVVMATRGHQDLLDFLRGSTTERVVRRAPCPVLALPETPS